jgi:hypothetical protein
MRSTSGSPFPALAHPPDGARRPRQVQAWPDPEPAPVTTIAWQLSHLAVGVFGLRASHGPATSA